MPPDPQSVDPYASWPWSGHNWIALDNVVDAIVINVPALKGWNLIPGQTVVIARSTEVNALLFATLDGG